MTKEIARIIGIGSYLPKQVLTNADLEKMVDTSDEWIVKRTGIKKRHLADEKEYTSTMGAKASIKAIENAQIKINDIDCIICATMTPDYHSSSVAAIIQSKIGANFCAALDIQAACTGFIYALSVAKAYVESNLYKNVLVVASEKMSSITDYQDRSSCILFGDGASAVIVSNQKPGLSLKHICLGSDGSKADLISIPAGGCSNPITQESLNLRLNFFKQDGKEVFKNAIRHMASICKDCLNTIGKSQEEITWFISHQANERIIDALAKNMKLNEEKVIKTVEKYGNTSAASIPLALDELLTYKEVKSGEFILLTAFGAGLTWGAAALQKEA